MRIVTPMLNIDYPFVYGIINLIAQQRINQTIYNKVLEMINQLQYMDIPTYVSMSYELKTNEKNVLSLSLIGLGDFRGAHPVTLVKSLNFDVNTGKNYTLIDLFKPGSNYVQVLSDMVAQQIKQRNIPILDEFKGIRPDQDYYIADRNLILYFQQAEITPYAAGIPYFSILIEDLQDIISDTGLLARMI
ncbi:MAG: DUF3298 and DUF4163 domain-containing protein [Clostridiaceae bacterium]|nr:DUF3298 and DUF4163 domain-containing protein [Clostridiaceae bacterium]